MTCGYYSTARYVLCSNDARVPLLVMLAGSPAVLLLSGSTSDWLSNLAGVDPRALQAGFLGRATDAADAGEM